MYRVRKTFDLSVIFLFPFIFGAKYNKCIDYYYYYYLQFGVCVGNFNGNYKYAVTVGRTEVYLRSGYFPCSNPFL